MIDAIRLDDFITWLKGDPLYIALVLLVTILVQSIVNRGIDRTLHRAVAHGSVHGERRAQRAESIGQLLGSTATLVVWLIAVLTIFSRIGIEIAPILASAGVLGVALGFGAQALVKDYLAGIFVVLEDQYGIGDTVDVGPVTGVVEDVSLRITRIRDEAGVIWYVRNGEIVRVANQSQGKTHA
jgi:small-conductance mechanosensitive channel